MRHLAALGFLVGFFLLMTWTGFKSPGLIYDNLLTQSMAATWAEQIRAQPGWDFISLRSPLYSGRLTAHLMFPLYYAFGRSPWLPEIWTTGFGALTILLLYAFLRQVTGRRDVPLAGAALLAAHPSFVMGVKCGNGQLSYLLFFVLASMMFLWRWRETGRTADLLIGMATAGMGLGTRVWYAAFPIALFGTAPFFAADLKRRLHLTWPAFSLKAAWAVLFFLLGAAPVIYTELSGGYSMGRVLAYENLYAPSAWEKILNGLRALARMLDGTTFFEFYFAGPPAGPNRLFPAATLAALVWNLLPGRPHRAARLWTAALFVGIALLGLRSAKPYTHHYFPLYPLPQILLAFALTDLWTDRRRWVKRAGIAAAALLLLGDLNVLRQMRARLASTGAVGVATDTMHDLVRFIKPLLDDPGAAVYIANSLEINIHVSHPQADSKALRLVPHVFARVPAFRPVPERIRGLLDAPAYRDRVRGLAEGGDVSFPPDLLREFEKAGSRPLFEDVAARERGRRVYLVHFPQRDDIFMGPSFAQLVWSAALWSEKSGSPLRLVRKFSDAAGPTFYVYELKV